MGPFAKIFDELSLVFGVKFAFILCINVLCIPLKPKSLAMHTAALSKFDLIPVSAPNFSNNSTIVEKFR